MSESYSSIKNRQLEAMLVPARERLKKYSPEDICRRAGVVFDAEHSVFLCESLGQKVHIGYPDFVVAEELDMWHHLTLLQYLDTADGSALAGTFMGLQEMPGGLSRGMGFDKDIETMYVRYFSKVSSERFEAACRSLGAEIVPGKADVTAVFKYAPRFPVCVTFWAADDEFPASGRATVDRNADHYLTVEAAGGACSAVIEKVRRALNA